MRILLYAVAFIVELVAWTACSAGVFLFSDGWVAWVLAAVVFFAVIGLWGAVMAPRARWPIPAPWYYLVKAVVYAAAAVVLWLYAPWAGVTFGAVVLLSEPLLYRYRGKEPVAAGSRLSRADGPDA